MRPQISLLIITGIVAALFWRLELELHGWVGLNWISYFHLAIPLGFVMFLSWLFCFVPIEDRGKRVIFIIVSAIVGMIWFGVVQFTLYFYFVGGPTAFVHIINVGEEVFYIYRSLIYAVIPITPLLFAGILCVFGVKPNRQQVLLSILIYLLACPVSVGLLIVSFFGSNADAIHTIKSGMIIPFLVVGLGVLIPDRRGKPAKTQTTVSPK